MTEQIAAWIDGEPIPATHVHASLVRGRYGTGTIIEERRLPLETYSAEAYAWDMEQPKFPKHGPGLTVYVGMWCGEDLRICYGDRTGSRMVDCRIVWVTPVRAVTVGERP